METQEIKKDKGFFAFIERVGNKIPHPVYLFVWLWIIAMLLSWLLSALGVSVVNPASGEVVEVVNMMTSAQWADFLKNMGKTANMDELIARSQSHGLKKTLSAFDLIILGISAIIGAGSVVTKDIPPYSVAVGAPARVIKSFI